MILWYFTSSTGGYNHTTIKLEKCSINTKELPQATPLKLCLWPLLQPLVITDLFSISVILDDLDFYQKNIQMAMLSWWKSPFYGTCSFHFKVSTAHRKQKTKDLVCKWVVPLDSKPRVLLLPQYLGCHQTDVPGRALTTGEGQGLNCKGWWIHHRAFFGKSHPLKLLNLQFVPTRGSANALMPRVSEI